MTQNYFGPTIFGTQNLFGHKYFWDPIIFWTNNFLDHKMFLDSKLFWTQKFSGPKVFSNTKFVWIVFFWTSIFWAQNWFGPNIFLDLKCFLDQKFVVPKFFGTNTFLGPKILMDPKYFWAQFLFGLIFSWTSIFYAQQFLEQRRSQILAIKFWSMNQKFNKNCSLRKFKVQKKKLGPYILTLKIWVQK